MIVTGAGSDIGEGVTGKLLDEGALVAGCGIEPEMHIGSSRVIYIQTNPTKFAQAQYAVEETMKAFGRVNKLVYCTGITFMGPLGTADHDIFMRKLSINMDGVSNICKAAISEPKKQKGSTTVNVGSDLGVRPTLERIGYCPSKAGAIMLTKCTALKYTLSVRVNAIPPGLVYVLVIEQRLTKTKDSKALEESYASLHSLHKAGRIEDIANATAFLSSDESGLTTGETMQIRDGGLI